VTHHHHIQEGTDMNIALPSWGRQDRPERRSRRGRAPIAIAAGLAALALATVVPAVAASAAPSHSAAAGGVVIVNCTGKGQVKPGRYILACADGNNFLTGLHWASWPAAARPGAAAFASGTDRVNDCIPSCAQGHFHSYPVLVTLWRAVPRAGHAGQLKFTRLTEIFTGKRPAHEPLTFTWHL
jgi:hypothetical protein